ncbi:hypothetical protein PYV61_14290, partial [Roseisolibacter sp. H3M3-2]
DGGSDAAGAGADDAHLLVLPLPALEGAVPTEPPAAVLAGVLGAALPRAGSPFLDASSTALFGAPAVRDAEDEETDDASDDDAPDADDATEAEADDPEEREEAEEQPRRRAAAPVALPEPEPAEVEPEAMAAALERLRARRHAPQHVEATVASDDGVVEHVADVASWLADATVREIRALAAEGWAGEEAIEVARTLAGDDPEIAEVVRHARRTEGELIVEIDARAAGAWLRANRPDVAEELEELLD